MRNHPPRARNTSRVPLRGPAGPGEKKTTRKDLRREGREKETIDRLQSDRKIAGLALKEGMIAGWIDDDHQFAGRVTPIGL